MGGKRGFGGFVESIFRVGPYDWVEVRGRISRVCRVFYVNVYVELGLFRSKVIIYDNQGCFG